MIEDSYSGRKGKRTLYGIRRVEKFLRKCTENYQRDAYIMKLDIEGFFMNKHRPTLVEKVKATIVKHPHELPEHVSVEWVVWLASVIIMSDVTKNCSYRCSRKSLSDLPKNKSMFHTPPDCGLPIGNHTSQLFANVYLNDMDRYIKEVLKIKYYGRYVDDFVLIHTDKPYLLECKQRIEDYLHTHLQLQLHRKKFYLQHYSKGVSFLGAYIKPYRLYAGKRLKTNAIGAIREWNTQLASGNQVEFQKLRGQMQSYIGMLKHYRSLRLQQKLFRMSHPIVQSYALAS